VSHLDLGPAPNLSISDLDGRAIINSTGKVTLIVFNENDCDTTPWDLHITAQHDYYDSILPKSQCRRVFNMIYTFGHLTPQAIHWTYFYCGARLSFNGNLVAKDHITGSFIVDVSALTRANDASTNHILFTGRFI
ncbi:hypothetical protein DFH28DRAFT_885654, partial [Melampsora americana]